MLRGHKLLSYSTGFGANPDDLEKKKIKLSTPGTKRLDVLDAVIKHYRDWTKTLEQHPTDSVGHQREGRGDRTEDSLWNACNKIVLPSWCFKFGISALLLDSDGWRETGQAGGKEREDDMKQGGPG